MSGYNQIVTTGIILSRREYGEADRILTFITPENGKITLLAKGVRKSKSKLAGGIELFSESHITFIRGRGEIGTLISTRLITHFNNIVSDIDRTMLGYKLLKTIDKTTEDKVGEDYYRFLHNVFKALDEAALDASLVELWFIMRLLSISGHAPNLTIDENGKPLAAGQNYTFDFEKFRFVSSASPRYGANHIKLLRLCGGIEDPLKLQKLSGTEDVLGSSLQLARAMTSYVLPKV